MTTTQRRAAGDRSWSQAGKESLTSLAAVVAKAAEDIDAQASVDAVHDMRTATRRLRTAIDLHRDEAPKRRRKTVEDELKRVSRRLGAVRDLDVLLEKVDADPGAADLEPLHDAWHDERSAGARRLTREVHRGRFDASLRAARKLVPTPDPDTPERPRVSTLAPGRIWDAFGAVLAWEVDPKTADPTMLHQVRIAAKRLRYTLEAFEDMLEPGRTLIDEVTGLQDSAGAMHDGIVAADRARTAVDGRTLTRRQRRAIDAFANGQATRAERSRTTVARHLRTVGSRAFRESLARSVAGIGSVR